MILEERVGYKAVGKRKLMKRRELDGSMHTKKKKEEERKCPKIIQNEKISMWKLFNKKETNEFNEKWIIPNEIHMKQTIDRQKEFWNLFFDWVFISPVPSMLRLICEPTSSVLLRLLVADRKSTRLNSSHRR